MSERVEALRALEPLGVLDGVRWAWVSARRHTVQTFDPRTGHDQSWVGYTAFKLYCDRLDRVFSCGRFLPRPAVPEGTGQPGLPLLGPAESGPPATGHGPPPPVAAGDGDPADPLAAGLSARERDTMPRIPAGVVVRDDLNHSPGWRAGKWRILLQSFGGTEVDRIPWPRKSWTKRRVADQPPPGQPMLPIEEFALMDHQPTESGDGAAGDGGERYVVTLVAAYSIDAVTGASALHLGRPRGDGGRPAWHWRETLIRS